MGQDYGNKSGQGMTGGQGGQGQGYGQGQGQGSKSGQGQGHGGGQGQGGSMPRDDQGQWKSPDGDKSNNPGGSQNR
jgi:hypothetical protein